MEANFRSSFSPIQKYTAPNIYNLRSQQDVEKRDDAYANALPTFLEKAENGCASSQYELGVMYAQGIGVEKDGKQAFFWSLKAYSQHHADACNTLGELFQQGHDVDKNDDVALLYFQEGAKRESGRACNNLGKMYLHGLGLGVARNVELARQYFDQAVRYEVADAYNNIGAMYELGYGVPKDDQQALGYYRIASQKGSVTAEGNFERLSELIAHEEAQLQLEHEQKLKLEVPIKVDEIANQPVPSSEDRRVQVLRLIKQEKYVDALPMLEKLVEEGCPMAQYELGKMFYEGKGVANDFKRAIGFFYKAAAQNSGQACSSIAHMFRLGYGVQKDFKISVEWYQKGIALNSANAYVGLAQMYQTGYGVKLNLDEAFKLHLKGCELGSSMAFNGLGCMYANGKGVEKDDQRAMEYCQKAIDLDGRNDIAIKNLNTLSKSVFEKYAPQAGNDHNAAFQVGLLYLNGWYVAQDVPRGERILKLAHQLGNKDALFKLGEWFMQKKKSEIRIRGNDFHDLEKYLDAAFDYLKQAANHGHPEALFTLGAWFEEYAVESFQKKAHDYYVAAVIQNHHPKAYEKVAPKMLLEANNFLKHKNYKSAFNIYKALFACGNAEAQLQLSLMYMQGLHVAHDHVKAEFLLVQAFELIPNRFEEVLAPLLLNALHFMENKNYQSAFEIYKPLVACGNAEAQLQLGLMYLQGLHVAHDPEKAEGLLIQAFEINPNWLEEVQTQLLLSASNLMESKNYKVAFYIYKLLTKWGNAEAQLQLGLMYMQGLHVANYNDQAEFLLVQASKSNPNRFEEVLASLLLKASNFIENKNYQSAFNIYKPLAACKNSEAQLQLGLMYMQGLHVKQSDTQTQLYLELAANQGNVEAVFKLGNWWHEGRSYFKQNSQEAMKWYELGSKLNHADSSFALGMMHEERHEKLTFLERAHQQGHPRAAYELAYLFYTSKFFNQSEADLIEAEKWAQIAVDSNTDKAQDLLADVRKKLDSVRSKWF